MNNIKFKLYILKDHKEYDVEQIWFNKDQITVVCDEIKIRYIDNKEYFLMEYTGLKDVNGREVYSNEIYKDNKGILYRIYKTFGGFGISLSPFKSTFTGHDQYFLNALAERQTVSWFESQCVYDGTIFDEKYKEYNLIY